MVVGVRQWLLRRDAGLLAVRRAVRVAAVACAVFYFCRYLVGDPAMATYAIFATVALGFLSQIPGSATQRALTLLWSAPVACLLVTIGTLLAGHLWAATAGMLVFGFFIAFAGVGGPRLVGLASGMQLLFILPCFPPYSPDALGSRLIGVCVGLGVLALAERTLWPAPDPVGYQERLADACQGLAGHLAARAAGDPQAIASTLAATEKAAQEIRPSHLPPEARPASAGRSDQALSDAGAMVRFALARLREMPPGMATPAAAGLLDTCARTARAAAKALRGAPAPDTEELADAFSALRHFPHDRSAPDEPDEIRMTTLALAAADGVWTSATAIRIALGAPIESGIASRPVRRERFPYAYMSTIRLWWRQFALHLTPRSVYFQGAVRVAVALAAARLAAGVLDLSHGFWVLLATLTLLRSRAIDTRIALRPAIVGTVAGAAAVGVLLVVVGPHPGLYATLMPPIMVVTFAAGTVFGPAWGQALFTVLVTLIFTQLAPANAELAGVRVLDVLIGAAIGLGAGVLAWPRGGGGELRRSAAGFLDASAQLVRLTAEALTGPPQSQDGDPSVAALARANQAKALANASYGMYQTERHAAAESTMDWQAVLAVGYHVVRGCEWLRDTYAPGALSSWRPLVTASASNVHDACDAAAHAVGEGRAVRFPRVQVPPPPDHQVADMQIWLAGVADDLTRLDTPPAPARR
ncbi:hypothetical protein Rhe02_19920 [Rhizocola hellebori]|uniref:Integral membrane bound transporter domain-containing protein n=1 Tax=Rhizocola hellebori TaxID=1392758 RepID=A0A8J3VEV6_9ACTN|nr:FUSC family protein [Rhizocola hellebori]GIH03925.1 hypothetical protein Rhe02_19920 [Rhizocola hellebori]